MSIKEQIPLNELQWYAVQCKFRCEKTLTAALDEEGVEAYVPIQRKVRQYASRKKLSESVLIPSHVFVHIKQSQYVQVLRHHHVFRFLNFSGSLTHIPEREIELMKRIVGEHQEVTIVATNYNKGDKVQIIGGELTGLEGELIDTVNHNFKIAITSLNMGLMIYVDPKNLLKIAGAKIVA